MDISTFLGSKSARIGAYSWSASPLSFPSCRSFFFLRPGAEATDEGVKLVPESTKHQGKSLLESFRLTVRDSISDTVRLFRGLLGQSGFYRLLSFLIFIGFLKVIVMQMDYVFPKFGIRELGDGAPVGRALGD